MADSNKESLREYIARIMKEKALRVRDIRRRSEDTITESYISEILNGMARNPSIEKLTALARGLGVDPVELFRVASSGVGEDESRKVADRLSAVRVLDMIRSIALSAELVALAEVVGQLTEKDAETAYGLLMTLGDDGDRQSD